VSRRDRRPLEEVGEDPDPRFTMANERTYLAWIRTSLGLVAAGLAVAEFLRSSSDAVRLAIAIPLLVLGAATALSAFGEWERKERAMRLEQPLPVSRIPRLLGLAVGTVAIVAAILALVDR
jgi:putative membrane protein